MWRVLCTLTQSTQGKNRLSDNSLRSIKSDTVLAYSQESDRQWHDDVTSVIKYRAHTLNTSSNFFQPSESKLNHNRAPVFALKPRVKRYRLFNKKYSLLLAQPTLRVCRRGFESLCILCFISRQQFMLLLILHSKYYKIVIETYLFVKILYFCVNLGKIETA